MIATNSPRLAANAVIAPATMPGSASGRVTLKNRSTGPAPSVAATAFRPGSMASSERRIARTWNGKVTMAAASAAPLQWNTSRIPKLSSSQAPTGARVPSEISSR